MWDKIKYALEYNLTDVLFMLALTIFVFIYGNNWVRSNAKID